MLGLQGVGYQHVCPYRAAGHTSDEICDSSTTSLQLEQIYHNCGKTLGIGSQCAEKRRAASQSDADELSDPGGPSRLLRAEIELLYRELVQSHHRFEKSNKK